ncbi:MAG: ATP-binding protein [Pseudomonadota bacterium]
MEDLSLHVLDVAENGVTAGANLIRVVIEENTTEDVLSIEIKDNGRGMDPAFLSKVLDPFTTTRTTRKVGLGLSLFQQTAQEAEGFLTVESVPGLGTDVMAVMKLSHIDRKPMGSMCNTILTLIEGNSDVDFYYEHRKNGAAYRLDTREIRAELEEVPINTSDVLRMIRDDLISGLDDIGASGNRQ